MREGPVRMPHGEEEGFPELEMVEGRERGVGDEVGAERVKS